ncbi:MAG: hypothetical protein HY741_09800 [Chloroflexi bacterium]|nr:hypothetical protein [Chloroflexota bacterium]
MPCSPSKPNIEPEDQPLSFRLQKWLGNEWVDELHLCAIYRDGIYYECRGPLFFRYDTFHERMGPIVYTGLRFGKYTFDNLSSREPLRIGLKLSASFSFNLKSIERKIAGVLINLSDELMCSLVEGEIVRWLRPQIAQFSNQQIRRGEIFELVGSAVLARLNGEPDLSRLGITVGKIQIEEPLLPEELEKGFVQAARRDIDVQSLQNWEDSEFARHLAVILAEKSSGEQYLNAADMFAALRETAPVPRVTRVIDSQPEFPPVAPSTAPPPAASNASGAKPAAGDTPPAETKKTDEQDESFFA